MSENAEAWLHEIERLVKAYAEAKAQRVYLEEFRKSKKALLMKQAEAEEPERYRSAASQEVYAYGHEEYLELLLALRDATETEAKHMWNLRQREWQFEWARTQAANYRAERARYGA